MRLDPLHNNLIVRLLPDAAAPKGVIQVVRLEQQPSQRAEVLAVGPEVRDVSVGQRVLVSRLQGIVFGDDVVLPESAVLAFLEEGE
mgnify:CR=1 FL=1